MVAILLLFLLIAPPIWADSEDDPTISVLVGPEEVTPHHYEAELAVHISPNFMEYFPLLVQLAHLTEEDTITIYIRRNFGGSALTLNILQQSLYRTKAKVIFKVEGMAFSAAAIILSSSNEIHMYHNAILLWHTGSMDAVRIRPGDEFYSISYMFNYFAFNKSVICIRPGTCMYNPFEKSLVSIGYWMNFLKGEDRFISGEAVCENIGADTHIDPENGLEYCKIRMLKGRQDERVEAI